MSIITKAPYTVSSPLARLRLDQVRMTGHANLDTFDYCVINNYIFHISVSNKPQTSETSGIKLILGCTNVHTWSTQYFELPVDTEMIFNACICCVGEYELIVATQSRVSLDPPSCIFTHVLMDMSGVPAILRTEEKKINQPGVFVRRMLNLGDCVLVQRSGSAFGYMLYLPEEGKLADLPLVLHNVLVTDADPRYSAVYSVGRDGSFWLSYNTTRDRITADRFIIRRNEEPAPDSGDGSSHSSSVSFDAKRVCTMSVPQRSSLVDGTLYCYSDEEVELPPGIRRESIVLGDRLFETRPDMHRLVLHDRIGDIFYIYTPVPCSMPSLFDLVSKTIMRPVNANSAKRECNLRFSDLKHVEKSTAGFMDLPLHVRQRVFGKAASDEEIGGMISDVIKRLQKKKAKSRSK